MANVRRNYCACPQTHSLADVNSGQACGSTGDEITTPKAGGPRDPDRCVAMAGFHLSHYCPPPHIHLPSNSYHNRPSLLIDLSDSVVANDTVDGGQGHHPPTAASQPHNTCLHANTLISSQGDVHLDPCSPAGRGRSLGGHISSAHNPQATSSISPPSTAAA